MPSTFVTRSTSSTVPAMAFCMSMTALRLELFAYFSRDQLKPPESQPPIAARCAEACKFPLEHDDIEAWIGLLQIVGGPQAGIAGADDADISLAIAG